MIKFFQYFFVAMLVFVPSFSFAYTEEVNIQHSTWYGEGSGTYSGGLSLFYISTPRETSEILNSVSVQVGSYYGGNLTYAEIYENPVYDSNSNILTSLGSLVATSDTVGNISAGNGTKNVDFYAVSTVLPFSSEIILNEGSTYAVVVHADGSYNSFFDDGLNLGGAGVNALDAQLIFTPSYILDLSSVPVPPTPTTTPQAIPDDTFKFSIILFMGMIALYGGFHVMRENV